MFTFLRWLSGGAGGGVAAQERRLLERLDAHHAAEDKPTECHKRTGKITRLTEEYGIVDRALPFSPSDVAHLKLNVGDVVTYIEYDSRVKILKVIESAGEEELPLEDPAPPSDGECAEQIIVGKVTRRQGRRVVVHPDNVAFNLDDVTANFVPVVGDWVEVTVKIQKDQADYSENDAILEVISLRCLRSKTDIGHITLWNEETSCGAIDDLIVFTKDSLKDIAFASKGDKVVYDAIESEQGAYMWRALSVVIMTSTQQNNLAVNENAPEENNPAGIEVSKNFTINLLMEEKKNIEITLRNTTDSKCTFFKAAFHCKYRDSQMRLRTETTRPKVLAPGETLVLLFECRPKFLGYSDEKIVFNFNHCNIIRFFQINVINQQIRNNPSNRHRGKNCYDMRGLQKIFFNENETLIPGIRNTKPPPFVNVRIPAFCVPDDLKKSLFEIYTQSDRNFSTLNLNDVSQLKPLLEPINDETYKQKFHLLLFLEEIHHYILFRQYDEERAHMTKSSEYLCLEIDDLCQKKPSLLVGDSAKVKNPWDVNGPTYEGVIHKIHDNHVLMKFCNEFHQNYRGEAVSIDFYFTRGAYRKCHFGIDLSWSHFGRKILFPDKIQPKESQLDMIDPSDDINDNHCETKDIPDIIKTRKIIWFNTNLNDGQKSAVLNILRGTLRPLPYLIFGPPGTGKTITLVETIFQILCLLPDSRLLIGTPSNSAANLIVERLLSIRNLTPGFLVRLVSHNYANNENIPESVKPFCATVNISSENSNKSTYHINDNGVSHGCGKSYIGRHRITIGTCVSLGSLLTLGFPRDHFTHVLVDEAGQSTEPEIMIPLSLISENSGQIILSGDPNQLGPVVTSPLAAKYGLTQPFMERLLTHSPYLKDVSRCDVSNTGYDERLVTQLTHNYRSIDKLLALTSYFFYNDTLICNIDDSLTWVKEYKIKLMKILERDTFPGVIFHGIRGVNYRGEDNPSWYNPQEASMVLMFLCKLYKNDIPPEDIGIITPYMQQAKYIYSLIADMGLNPPKIGSVEEFQGQERKIIILSTVRSEKSYLKFDLKRHLGFVNNAKRMNVAMSRAQILLIIFGNPHLLCIDPQWYGIIKYIIKHGLYLGCDLPEQIQ